jgi:hypothetical protein
MDEHMDSLSNERDTQPDHPDQPPKPEWTVSQRELVMASLLRCPPPPPDAA